MHDQADRILGFLLAVGFALAMVYLCGTSLYERVGACIERQTESGQCVHRAHRLALEPGAKICRCEGSK